MYKKSCEFILIYKISYKTLIGAKPLRIRFNKVDGTRYLVLFGPVSSKWYYICFSHNYAKIKIDYYDSLPLKEILTFHNVIILIKSVFNKDQNQYYYKNILRKMFLSIR